MEKFSFSEKRDLLIPQQTKLTQFKDQYGNPINGDALFLKFAEVASEYTKKTGKPVPIAEQSFVAWLKEGAEFIKNGGSSEEYFKSTLVAM